jgi:hypothetical protein
MNQLEIVRAFLTDPLIQQKYGLSPNDIAQMTMQSHFVGEAEVLANVLRRMVSDADDPNKSVNVAAAALNQLLNNALQ